MLVGWNLIKRYYSQLYEIVRSIVAGRKRLKIKTRLKKLLRYVNSDIEKHEQDAKEYFKKVDELIKKM